MSSVCLSKVYYIGRGGEGEREGEREREREREGKREKERENLTERNQRLKKLAERT